MEINKIISHIDENNLNPLVTIIVLTYNSSKYIIETLDSAKSQSYSNIELIISDDCSTDNTIELCEDWVKKNRDVFANVILLQVKKNTGIPGNCNRGLDASNGVWIKLIAGDDLLHENAIDYFVSFTNKNSHVKALYSKFKLFNDDFALNRLYLPSYSGYNRFYSRNITPNKQFKLLLRRNFFHGPTFFVSRELLKSIGGFDESYKFEDLPIALKITQNNYKLFFLNKETVYYRIHKSSITNSEDKLFSGFYKETYRFNKEFVFRHANVFLIAFKAYEYYRHYYLEKLGLNKNTFFCKLVYRCTMVINPLNFYNIYF